jgi:hypothetical protein
VQRSKALLVLVLAITTTVAAVATYKFLLHEDQETMAVQVSYQTKTRTSMRHWVLTFFAYLFAS